MKQAIVSAVLQAVLLRWRVLIMRAIALHATKAVMLAPQDLTKQAIASHALQENTLSQVEASALTVHLERGLLPDSLVVTTAQVVHGPN